MKLSMSVHVIVISLLVVNLHIDVHVCTYTSTCSIILIFCCVYFFSRDPSEGPPPLTKKEQEYYTERLELAVEFIYCMTLVEILQKVQ